MPQPITAARLQDVVLTLFAQVPGSGLQNIQTAGNRLCFVDNAYSPVSFAEVDRVVRSNPLLVPPSGGADELSDCDDYALQVKSILTTLKRQQNVGAAEPDAPPAIGIIISEIHAVSGFVSAGNAGLKLALIDASRPDRPVVDAPDQVADLLLGRPGIRLVYF